MYVTCVEDAVIVYLDITRLHPTLSPPHNTLSPPHPTLSPPHPTPVYPANSCPAQWKDLDDLSNGWNNEFSRPIAAQLVAVQRPMCDFHCISFVTTPATSVFQCSNLLIKISHHFKNIHPHTSFPVSEASAPISTRNSRPKICFCSSKYSTQIISKLEVKLSTS